MAESQPRQCFAVFQGQFTPGKGYIPSVVKEGEPDHWPLIGGDEQALPYYWGMTLEEAQAACDRANANSYGLTPEEAQEIIDSSIMASVRRDAARERAQADYIRKLDH